MWRVCIPAWAHSRRETASPARDDCVCRHPPSYCRPIEGAECGNRLDGEGLDWVGRADVRERTGERTTRGLTGLEAYFAPVGPYRSGVIVVQDQEDDGTARLKFLDWAEVRTALGL